MRMRKSRSIAGRVGAILAITLSRGTLAFAQGWREPQSQSRASVACLNALCIGGAGPLSVGGRLSARRMDPRESGPQVKAPARPYAGRTDTSVRTELARKHSA